MFARLFPRIVFAAVALAAVSAESPKPGESGPEAVKAPFAAGAGGTFTLHARQATVRGKTLRYEPKPEKNTLGFWTDAADWASWEIDAQAAGSFLIEVLQACGKGSGGSEVEIIVTGTGGTAQSVRFVVEDTGHFQNFVRRAVGSVTLAAVGRYTVAVKPINKPPRSVAVMDLRELRLVPKESK
jgi:arylsulfatase A